MHFAIRYLTEYRYEQPVTDNLNALRVRPATTSSQRTDDFIVRLDPETRIHRHADYFGTEVIEFGIAEPHDHLTMDVRARVVTAAPSDPPEAEWEMLRARSYREAAGEFLLPTGAEPPEGVLDDLFAVSRAKSPLATVRLLCELIPDHFVYRPGVTYVGSTIEDLLEEGGGVCQDFVHLALVLLRRQGIAARYVSGYLHPKRNAKVGDTVDGQSHAWIQAWTGEWWNYDPTNDTEVNEQYISVGVGRDYADVTPLKGIYSGEGSTDLDVVVEITRLA